MGGRGLQQIDSPAKFGWSLPGPQRLLRHLDHSWVPSRGRFQSVHVGGTLKSEQIE